MHLDSGDEVASPNRAVKISPFSCFDCNFWLLCSLTKSNERNRNEGARAQPRGGSGKQLRFQIEGDECTQAESDGEEDIGGYNWRQREK